MRQSRLQEFDVLKGILIIFVIIGHASSLDPSIRQWIFWFHMPAFFMICGFLTNNWKLSKRFIIQKTEKFVIPYIAYCVVMWLLIHPEPLFKNVVRVLYGGANNTTSYSYPYWFINALFVSQLMFSILCKFLKGHRLCLFLVMTCCWILCHITSLWNALSFPLPWSVDQSIGAVVFIYVGYIAKGYIGSKWNNLWFCIPLVCLLLFVFNIPFDYELNMKAMKYNNLVLDLLVPCGFTFMLYKLSAFIQLVPYLSATLSYIGERSISIFYLHALLLNRLHSIGIDSLYIVVPAIIIFSLTIHYIFAHTYYLSKIFIGK